LNKYIIKITFVEVDNYDIIRDGKCFGTEKMWMPLSRRQTRKKQGRKIFNEKRELSHAGNGWDSHSPRHYMETYK